MRYARKMETNWNRARLLYIYGRLRGSDKLLIAQITFAPQILAARCGPVVLSLQYITKYGSTLYIGIPYNWNFILTFNGTKINR